MFFCIFMSICIDMSIQWLTSLVRHGFSLTVCSEKERVPLYENGLFIVGLTRLNKLGRELRHWSLVRMFLIASNRLPSEVFYNHEESVVSPNYKWYEMEN